MASVETERPRAHAPATSPPRPTRPARRRIAWRWGVAVVALMAGALVLRLWGIKQGLPWAYNIDENAHFVPRAIGFFGHTLNPFYFVNPPGMTNLYYVVFGAWFGGGDAAARAYALDPSEVYIVARATTAVLSTAAVGLLYLAGARLFDRRVGLVAAALLTVSFLPVFYSHLALNDSPILAPVALCLWGVARIVRGGGGRWDWVIAGVGLGVAMAIKYTAGIMLVPILVAALFVWRDSEPDDAAAARTGGPGPRAGGRAARAPERLRGILRWTWGVLRTRAFRLLVLAGVFAVVGFVVASPYSLLDPKTFAGGILHQASASNAEGKLGNTQENGIVYYLWTITWGIGWVPAAAMLAGAIVLGVRRSRAFWLLVPAAVIYVLFMGSAERYFGRWLMPLFPILIVLAAVGALWAVDALARRVAWRRAGPVLAGLAVVALCAQGLVYSVHNDALLSRADTRQQVRDWLDRNLPPSTKVVVEPIVPDSWTRATGRTVPPSWEGNRYHEFFPTDTSDSNGTLGGELAGAAAAGGLGQGADAAGAAELGGRLAVSLLPSQLPDAVLPNRRRQDVGVVGGEGYTRDLSPELLDVYRGEGACYVVTGSVQSQRALVDPARVPEASRYYAALRRQATPVYRASPYDPGAKPVAFNFDWSFDYYPLSYDRPGPDVTVYKLRGGRCGR